MTNNRVDVARLLDRLGMTYRAEGHELWARCPAHNDTHPSWSINQTTGMHHCFACGWGGSVASLVIRVLGGEALAWTQHDAWLWIREQGLLEGNHASAVDVELYLRLPVKRRLVLPSSVVMAPLSEWPTPVSRYVRARRIAEWQIRRWDIGYATRGRLAGRIVFPVHDKTGRLLSYSARSFVGELPRYLTPRGQDGADEAALFGERYWPGLGARRRVVVVEGAIKALAVERAVGGHVAGILGATQAANAHVIAKLATFDEVVVLTDNDLAGDVAADALVGSLSRHVVVHRARIVGPAVDDADPEAIVEVI
jgi:DNA primase